MSDLVIYGMHQSTYTRMARMAAEEKGVPHRLEIVDVRSPEHRKLHPFGKMPVMEHGSVRVYETIAIFRYIDDTFEGPALFGRDAATRAAATQWASVVHNYGDPAISRGILFERFVAPRFFNRPPDEDAIRRAIEPSDYFLSVVEKQLAGRDWLAGSDCTVADCFLAPIVFWFRMVPEGKELLPKYPAVGRWYERVAARPSFAATMPPMPETQAAE